MINSTKNSIADYASEVYHLKNVVSDVNGKYSEIGFGVGKEVFEDIDRHFTTRIPQGNKSKLYEYMKHGQIVILYFILFYFYFRF